MCVYIKFLTHIFLFEMLKRKYNNNNYNLIKKIKLKISKLKKIRKA